MARNFKNTAKTDDAAEIKDVYKRITDKIIASLEAGTKPWQKMWRTGNPGAGIEMPLRHDGTPYRGVNVLMLWAEAMAKGYTRSIWMTYRQATALGGQVRKGERSALVVYANKVVKTEIDAVTGQDEKTVIPFLKGYSVFNVEQIDGLPAHYYAINDEAAPEGERIAAVAEFVKNTGAIVREAGDKAFYAPHGDFIQMPPASAFLTAEAQAATLLHELVHWTGHDKRLAREFEKSKRFGSEGYAAEELVAELGAAFLCASLAVRDEGRPDHAAYVQSWIKVLKGDKRFVFTAASAAQRAADFLHQMQPGTVAEVEDLAEAA